MYYRRFIQGFAKIAKCLHVLTGKNSTWNWTTECTEAFELLKERLVSAPILGYPNVNGGEFILDTDASNDAIGAVLSQKQDGREVVICYGSRVLSNSEKNYCVTRKEMLAVVYSIKQFKHYLLRREFLLRTDHGSLVWLHKMKEPEGQMARWLEQLGPYTFKIQHRSGRQHGNADAMSRIPCDSTCKQCKNRTSDNINKRFSHVSELRETFRKTQEDKDVLALDNLLSVNVSECAPISGNSKCKANRPARAKARTQPTEPLQIQNIRKHQIEDNGMRIIIQEKGEKPPLSVISCENSECKFWFSRWELLFMDRGILCIRWINSGTGKEGYKICVPRKLRSVILWQLHDSNCAGHMGE